MGHRVWGGATVARDISDGSWYINLNPKWGPGSVRTHSGIPATLKVDYDENGQVVGIEIHEDRT